MTPRHLFCLALVLAASPAEAVDWVWEQGGYELGGADLFRMRDALGNDAFKALGPLRNVGFETSDQLSEAALAAAPLLSDEQLQALLDAARKETARIGIEQRGDGAFTLIVSGSEAIVESAFAAQSWLATVPPEAATPALSWVANGACLDLVFNGAPLFSACDATSSGQKTSLHIAVTTNAVYGLGQHFARPGETEVNRIGQTIDGTNHMGGFNGGANGNTMIPIAYVDAEHPFALILDNRFSQDWTVDEKGLTATTSDGVFDLIVLTADSLPDLRRRFMAMSGRPPVPPKEMFGLWISEYGYDDWSEVADKVGSLLQNQFPLSGIVLDLQWFGGIRPNSVNSPMGSLTWDEAAFPEPEGHVRELLDHGIGTMLIEESYVSSGLESFEVMASQNFLARNSMGEATLTDATGHWWGRGGMIDWINPDAGAFWHDAKRAALIDMGVIGHWTDLGEPEMFNRGAVYGVDDTPHLAIHNSYNLEWLRSIAEGYARTHPDLRPFMMSRSGGMGMQALGAVMWSGDTGSDYGSLAAQMAEQGHMMWSGIDYYGSDIGGFHRGALASFPSDATRDDAMNLLYTQWLAYASLFEIPVRPHTENLCNCKETAPDRIGDLASNRANLWRRYAMLPYYYSLAHQAYRTGEPIFPSLAYVFPDDAAVRTVGHQKMIGTHVMGAAVATYGATEVSVYLPEGLWFDTERKNVMSGGQTHLIPLYDDGLFRLPLLARNGALVPILEGPDLVLNVYGHAINSFTLVDDDGRTTAYQSDTADIVYALDGYTLTIDEREADGLTTQKLVWRLNVPDALRAVQVNGVDHPFSYDGISLTMELPGDPQTTIRLLF